MKTPPPEQLERLAHERETISRHEAGHCMVAYLLDLPLHSVTLENRLRHHASRGPVWWAYGYTSLVRRGTVGLEEDDGVRFTLGGPEAEALWISHRDGMSLKAARRITAGTHVNRNGDFAELRKWLRDAEVTQDEAQEQVHGLLRRSWGGVERIAAQLRKNGTVSGREIRRLAR